MKNLCSVYKIGIFIYILIAILFFHFCYGLFILRSVTIVDYVFYTICFVILCACHFYIIKIKNNLDNIEYILTKWRVGDLDHRLLHINEPGAMGEVLYCLNDFVDRLDAFLRETILSMKAISEDKFYRKIISTGMLGSFKISSDSINKLSELTETKTLRLSEAADKLETDIQRVIEDVREAASKVKTYNHSMVDMAKNSYGIAKGVDDEASVVQTSLDAVSLESSKITQSISDINNKIIYAGTIANDAVHEATNATNNIDSLQHASRQIADVINFITDIAEQTTLLALNASIEAVRAGKVGQGFAVVASEVKMLANETVSYTDRIVQQVNSLQQAIDRAVSDVSSVIKIVKQINEITKLVSVAISEQDFATKKVSQTIHLLSSSAVKVKESARNMSDNSKKNNNYAQEVDFASDELVVRINKLGIAIGLFSNAFKTK